MTTPVRTEHSELGGIGRRSGRVAAATATSLFRSLSEGGSNLLTRSGRAVVHAVTTAFEAARQQRRDARRWTVIGGPQRIFTARRVKFSRRAVGVIANRKLEQMSHPARVVDAHMSHGGWRLILTPHGDLPEDVRAALNEVLQRDTGIGLGRITTV